MNPLILPVTLLTRAREFFEESGSRGFEGTALIKDGMAGPQLLIPDQIPSRDSFGGVSVEVTHLGQMQMARDLGLGELYVARIHSHPAEAFHSLADDQNPVLIHEGAISIVVPFFGLGLRQGLNACAVFRRQNYEWCELPTGRLRDRFIVSDPATGYDNHE